MTILSAKRGRIEVYYGPAEVRVAIPPSRTPAGRIFMLVWVVVIASVAVTWWPRVVDVFRAEWRERMFGAGDLFIALILTALTWGMLQAILTLVWQHTGRDEVTVRNGLVWLGKRIGPLIWRGRALGKLESIAVTPGGRLALGAEGRTFRVSSDISSEEAARIIPLLRLHLTKTGEVLPGLDGAPPGKLAQEPSPATIDPSRREKLITRLWQGSFGLAFLLVACLIAVGVYTEYDPEPLAPYLFGSIAIATGAQLIVFRPHYDRMIARQFPDQPGGVKLPARLFGLFFMFVGAGMIFMTWTDR